MPVIADLRNGTRVRVSAPDRGAVVGEISDMRDADNLVDLPEMPGLGAKCSEILREWGVSRIAMITYNYGGEMVMFTVLETDRGWRDLRGQRLTVEIVGQVERPQRNVP